MGGELEEVNGGEPVVRCMREFLNLDCMGEFFKS